MALTKDDLQAISELMDAKLEPINERLDGIEDRLDNIEEEVKIARYTSEELMKWVELNFSHKYPFPIDRDINAG